MLRLTETRGSRSCPAAAHASRKRRICSAWSSWNGTPASSVISVDDIRFMPCWAAHSAVGREPAPHQIRSRSPGECGSGRSRPGGFGNIGEGLGSANPAPERAWRNTSVCWRAMSAPTGSPSAGCVAEVAEAVDHLLRRAAADPELEATAGDEVGRAGVLDHVQRVLVAHVDDRGPDLDPLRPGADRREQRERRGELLGEVVDPEVGAVGTEVLDRLGELDRLDERVRRRPDLRVRRGRPVTERQEPDLLHQRILRARRLAAAISPARGRGRTRTATLRRRSRARRSRTSPPSGRPSRTARPSGPGTASPRRRRIRSGGC